jgi:hypothetical protein
MIQEFVNRFMANKEELADMFKNHPKSYESVVRNVITAIQVGEYDDMSPDPERIHCIDDGDYQGTLVFVIAGKGYQPSEYWYVKVDYGSCSGCDTLQAIEGYSDEPPSQSQIDQYMILALHIVQGLKRMGDSEC